jgi:hypothetical protein
MKLIKTEWNGLTPTHWFARGKIWGNGKLKMQIWNFTSAKTKEKKKEKKEMMMIRHNNTTEKKVVWGKKKKKKLRKIVLIITEKKVLSPHEKAKNSSSKGKNQFKKLSFNALHSF